VYLTQFFMITLIAIPLGLIGGYFMVQVIFKSLISAIGAVNFEVSLWPPAILTFLTFLIGILVITYATARQAAKISPVTAIRFSRLAFFTIQQKKSGHAFHRSIFCHYRTNLLYQWCRFCF